MKDPAFLFYSKDFLTGVADLTMEERGQYITLLCLQHQKGRLTRKLIDLAAPDATADVLSKFEKDEQGNFFNRRLEEEASKRANHSDKQRDRALKGWEKRKQKTNKKDATAYPTAEATALPLVNANVNVNVNEDVIKEERVQREEIVFKYNSDEMRKAWKRWKDYRKSVHRFKYYDALSEQRKIRELENMATDEKEAIELINQSITEGYKGFFKKDKERKRLNVNPGDLIISQKDEPIEEKYLFLHSNKTE